MNPRRKSTVHHGETDATPEEVGFLPERLDQLDAHFLELIAGDKLQGASYLLARHGQVFAHRSMGKLKCSDDSPPLMPDSIRRIASITKSFTAVAIMQLVEDGKLHLEQAVHTIIKEFDTDAHRDISIFHLLTHTSGLPADPGYFLEPYPKGWWYYAEADEKVSWIEAILSGPVQCKPGEAWNYSSAGYCLLGEIVSRVSGTPVEQYIPQRTLAPLGMKRSFFRIPKRLHDQVCTTSEWDEKHLAARRSKKERTRWPPPTAGGLHSSLPDLWRFGQMLQNQGTLDGVRILGRKTVEAMTRNHLPGGLPAFSWGARKMKCYGLGLDLSPNKDISSPGTFNHEGSGACGLYVDPVEELVVVYFVPTAHDWIPEAVVSPRAIIWSGLV